MRKIIAPALILGFLGLGLSSPAMAAPEDYLSIVYFTGIGCSHCEATSPVVIEELTQEYPNLVVVEYEFYSKTENAAVLDQYVETYRLRYQIPLVIFNEDLNLVDQGPINNSLREMLNALETNDVPLADGSSQSFNELDPDSLPGFPLIWHQERVLIREGQEGADGELLKDLLFSDNLPDVLENIEFESIEPTAVVIPGGEVSFENAIKINDWVLQWNGTGVTPPEPIPPEPLPPEPEPPGPAPEPVPPEPEPTPPEPTPEPEPTRSISIPKILTLAAADSVNPCTFAVLLLMLVSIIAYNPGKRRNILLAGVGFIGAVFAMYFVYGLVFIRSFQLIQTLKDVGSWVFLGLAIAAIIFGILNIRDFVKYKPGRAGSTEMPIFLRPRVKKLMSAITSTRGAVVAGILVSVFLLPCTIGPYIIAAGIMAEAGLPIAQNTPPLLLYNLVFVIPMIAIVLGVYFGTGKVHDFYKWKERNMGKMHLVAGCMILGLGIFLFLQWFGIIAPF